MNFIQDQKASQTSLNLRINNQNIKSIKFSDCMDQFYLYQLSKYGLLNNHFHKYMHSIKICKFLQSPFQDLFINETNICIQINLQCTIRRVKTTTLTFCVCVQDFLLSLENKQKIFIFFIFQNAWVQFLTLLA